MITSLARAPLFVAVVWVTGALKLLLGLVALALVQPWKAVPRWLPLAAAWVAGIFMALYGGANLLVRGLMALGVIATPASMHSVAATWHLLLWDPWWLLGGVLFIALALRPTKPTGFGSRRR
jgi:uncharacterized membrane protein